MMNIVPFSQLYPDDFLSREEDNFDVFLDRVKHFYKQTRADIGDGNLSRRKLYKRFDYESELKDTQLNQEGITSEEVMSEFNDMIRGCVRHQDPSNAFNMIPSPLFDVVAGTTLLNLYTPNLLMDIISGKLCLYEKKIIRSLGQLVEWPKAEGFVVTGGKQALIYAIKSGIGRATFDYPCEIGDLVVICSDTAHFCINHACHYLGISPENCIRVETLASGEMNIQALEKALKKAHADGKRVASVIATGGGTVNMMPDPILEIRQTIDRFVQNNHIDYTPHLHVDSVISWIWLAFKDNDDWREQATQEIAAKIDEVVSRLKDIHCADSFAGDFHKTGFCPYSAGVFVAKDVNTLASLRQDRSLPSANMRFGEAEIYKYTLENSRPGTAVAAIWIALRRLGLQGLRQYVLYQLKVCEKFKQRIQQSFSEHFEVINPHSKGWEIVIKPHFNNITSWEDLQKATSKEQREYTDHCQRFLNAMWYDTLEEGREQAPFIGFVRSYSSKGKQEKSLPAFLIYPSSLHYDTSSIEELLDGLSRIKVAYENQNSHFSKRMDEDFLCRFTPPR